MSTKFLLLVLGTFLLVQSSLSKALPSAEDSTEQTVDSTEEPITWDLPESPKKAFFLYVLVEFAKVADTALTTGKKLFQDVIADVSAQNDKNEQITAKLAEYSKLVAEIEKLQTEDNSRDYIDKIELMVELGDVLEKANVSLIENPNSVDELFGKSFAKNGLDDLEKDVMVKFDAVFSEEFFETADKILNSDTNEKWPERSEIQDWLKKFNMEKDPEKKTGMFDELIALL